jgi:fatty acid desaturase
MPRMTGSNHGVDTQPASREERATAIEWPTLALAAVIYGGWIAMTWWHDLVPMWLLIPVGAWLVAWHSSLQHELLHGHPTASARINHALGFPPLSLWLSYGRFRASHLRHHRDEHLTDPLDDPESAYVEPGRWQNLNPLCRALIRAQTTLLGRLVLGPAWIAGNFLLAELRGIAAGDRARMRTMIGHLCGIMLVALWVKTACDMSLWFYLLAIVYPGTSLLLIRSFAEHRAADQVGERTAIVENAWLLGPLFLFNNLHAAHHERPKLPWYRLPRWYRANRDRLVAQNCGQVYNGYGEVFRRFLVSPHHAPAHPSRAACLSPAIEPSLLASLGS